MKLLAVDIGNTTLNFGLFSDNRLVRKKKISLRELFKASIPFLGFDAAAISSVVPDLTPKVAALIKKTVRNVNPVEICYRNAPIKMNVGQRRQVGADRIINAIAADKLYGPPAIVIDLGTATTFDVVSFCGEYSGGVIAPGLNISLDALYEKTAKLPRPVLRRPKSVVGRNTNSAILSGIVYGHAGLINEVLNRIKKEFFKSQSVNVILTGGYAGFMASYLDNSIIIDEDITLKGIEIAYKMILCARTWQ
ncbi:MAG: Type III pantothenate kinase [Elusimicrobia bacterium ADurb.Bin231]|nr:MAG: Type III pantothenate kinase [Elusimicrobia bacterium ADurb.Bin231]